MPLGRGGRRCRAGNVNSMRRPRCVRAGPSEGAWVLSRAILDCVNIFLRSKERVSIHWVRSHLKELRSICLGIKVKNSVQGAFQKNHFCSSNTAKLSFFFFFLMQKINKCDPLPVESSRVCVNTVGAFAREPERAGLCLTALTAPGGAASRTPPRPHGRPGGGMVWPGFRCESLSDGSAGVWLLSTGHTTQCHPPPPFLQNQEAGAWTQPPAPSSSLIFALSLQLPSLQLLPVKPV